MLPGARIHCLNWCSLFIKDVLFTNIQCQFTSRSSHELNTYHVIGDCISIFIITSMFPMVQWDYTYIYIHIYIYNPHLPVPNKLTRTPARALICFIIVWHQWILPISLAAVISGKGTTRAITRLLRPKALWTRDLLQCASHISHNAPICNRNVHICAQYCYKMCLMYCGICEMGL